MITDSKNKTQESISYEICDSYDKVSSSKNSIRFIYANVRSIVTPRKLDEVKCIVKSFQNPIHFLILTETWIKNEDQAKRIQIDGYKHYYSYRCNNRGGGVSVFALASLEHYEIEERSSDGNHFVWIHAKNYALDIVAVYRKPGLTNIKDFLDCYSHFLQKSQRTVILGDFNLNLLSNDSAISEYKNILNENSCRIMNKIDIEYCTRETISSKSIIDHVSCSLTDNNFHLALIETPLSDHKQIYFEIKKHENKQIKKIKYESINYGQLSKLMTEGICNENCNYELLEQRLLLWE